MEQLGFIGKAILAILTSATSSQFSKSQKHSLRSCSLLWFLNLVWLVILVDNHKDTSFDKMSAAARARQIPVSHPHIPNPTIFPQSLAHIGPSAAAGAADGDRFFSGPCPSQGHQWGRLLAQNARQSHSQPFPKSKQSQTPNLHLLIQPIDPFTANPAQYSKIWIANANGQGRPC